MKGTKVLIMSSTQMYVYLPAFDKVRRIASHTTKDRSFLGMTFSPDDFPASYGGDYSASIATATPASYELVLAAKGTAERPYARIEMTVARDRMVPTELRYFDETGKKVKTETRSNYTCQDDICDPRERKMADDARPGAWTKLVRKAWEVNVPLSDDLFSARSLAK
jgi:hypothetical protein